MAKSKKRRSLPGYLDQSRSFVNSLVLMVPLLAVYEAALCLSHYSVQNRFDFLTGFIETRGFKGLLIFNALLFAAAVFAVAYLGKRKQFDPAVWPGIIIEGLSYALVLGSCVILLMAMPAQRITEPKSLFVEIGLALGAGVYEELFFRFIMLGMVYTWLTHTVRLTKFPALTVSFAVSSALFALCHFQTLSLANIDPARFLFYLCAGIVLGGIFVVRGLGVAIYTHAIYNVLVILNPL